MLRNAGLMVSAYNHSNRGIESRECISESLGLAPKSLNSSSHAFLFVLDIYRIAGGARLPDLRVAVQQHVELHEEAQHHRPLGRVS